MNNMDFKRVTGLPEVEVLEGSIDSMLNCKDPKRSSWQICMLLSLFKNWDGLVYTTRPFNFSNQSSLFPLQPQIDSKDRLYIYTIEE